MECEAKHMEAITICERCNHKFVPNSKTQNHPAIPAEQIRYNRVPLEKDIPQNRIFLQEEEEELKRYEDEAVRLRSALEQLEVQRKTLEKKVEERRSWLSPIRRLPREILEEIFTFVSLHKYGHALQAFPVVRGSGVGLPDRTLRIHAPALDLSHVSHYWRWITNDFPRLWSSISVDVFELDEDIRPLVNHYLRKSKDYPLDIVISDSETPNRRGRCIQDHLGRHGLDITKMILWEHPRIERLQLEFDEDILSVACIQHISFPALDYFCNGMRVLQARAETKWFWDAIHDAPNLLSAATDYPLPRCMLPYERLRHLSITSNCETEQLLHILRICASLRSLECHELEPALMPWDETELVCAGVTPSHLHHLSIAPTCGPRDLNFLFEHLTAPSLASFEILDNYSEDLATEHDEPWSLRPFIDFLRRSRCKLVDLLLEVPSSSILDTEFLEVLEVCPTLSAIEVNVLGAKKGSDTLIYKVLQGLRPRENSQTMLVPVVEDFIMTEVDSSIDSETASNILDIIELRNAVGLRREDVWNVQLEFSNLAICETGEKRALEERMQRLSEDGVDCSIRWTLAEWPPT
ncbi:hypothetical protein VNI00_015700 [Paramarasmius palmivorus]|uniref:F-box domain-containing protein n=1 Tax=Paramarasmius palmivorus TaxID=297713 RepID=A0AAW0BII7_9AGAR